MAKHELDNLYDQFPGKVKSRDNIDKILFLAIKKWKKKKFNNEKIANKVQSLETLLNKSNKNQFIEIYKSYFDSQNESNLLQERLRDETYSI